MPVTLSAANRLRLKCLAVPDTILLVDPGRPDKVLRVTPMPESLKAHRETLKNEGDARHRQMRVDAKKNGIEDFTPEPFNLLPHTVLFLNVGPQQEVWRSIEREIQLNARRDITIPEPMAVADSTEDEWSISPEDVPVVHLRVIEVAAPLVKPEDVKKEEAPEAVMFKCDKCPRVFEKKVGLVAHSRKHDRQA